MAAKWDRLAEAVQEHQYQVAASILQGELEQIGCERPEDLVSLLAGVTQAVADAVGQQGGDVHGFLEPFRELIMPEPEPDLKEEGDDQDEEVYRTRWLRRLRKGFDEDAAVILLEELSAGYKSSREFLDETRIEMESLDMSKGAKAAQLQEALFDRVLYPAIENFGFPPTPEGAREVTAKINEMEGTSPAVKTKFLEANRNCHLALQGPKKGEGRHSGVGGGLPS